MAAVSYPIEILHLTDPHILPAPGCTLMGVDTAYYLDAVLHLATQSRQSYDLCLLTGDLVQDPSAEAYRHLLSILERYDLEFTCLPGNHDDPALMQTMLATPTINCSKQLILGNWQIICLDSSLPGTDKGHLVSAEFVFLERCIVENPGLFVLVAVHHHCIPAESAWIDTMMIGNASELLALVEKYPQVKTIINGHIHQQMEKKLNSLQILTTPSTCFQFAPHCLEFKLDCIMPGYRRLQLYPDGGIRTEVKRLPGAGTVAGLQIASHGY